MFIAVFSTISVPSPEVLRTASTEKRDKSGKTNTTSQSTWPTKRRRLDWILPVGVAAFDFDVNFDEAKDGEAPDE